MVCHGRAQCPKCTGIALCPPKTVHFTEELQPMYRSQDRTTRPLFPELFLFGGKFDERNRWLRIAEPIPWQDLEDEYRKAFSDIGRPGKNAQLVIGGGSDRRITYSKGFAYWTTDSRTLYGCKATNIWKTFYIHYA